MTVADPSTLLGNVFSYASMTALAPDYDIGFVLLVAGNSTTGTAEHLTDTIIASIFPALEETARQQAHKQFAGTYESTTESLVSSNITLTTQVGQPGLVIDSWYSNGTNFLAAIAGVEGVKAPATLDARMYPSGLSQEMATGQRIGFRAVYGSTATSPNAGYVGGECSSWGSVDSPRYGNVGVDEFEFVVEGGEVVSLSPRALRVVLKKTA